MNPYEVPLGEFVPEGLPMDPTNDLNQDSYLESYHLGNQLIAPSGQELMQPENGQWQNYPNYNENSTAHMQHNNKKKAFRGYANVNSKGVPSNKMLVMNPSSHVN